MFVGVLCLLTLSVISDLENEKIPNALTAAGLTAGLILQLYGDGPPGLLMGVKSTILVWMVTFLLYRIRAIRGGDGKLLTAIAASLGLKAGMTIMVLSLFCGALQGIFKMLTSRTKNHFTTIHYSVAILLATILYLEGWY